MWAIQVSAKMKEQQHRLASLRAEVELTSKTLIELKSKDAKLVEAFMKGNDGSHVATQCIHLCAFSSYTTV